MKFVYLFSLKKCIILTSEQKIKWDSKLDQIVQHKTVSFKIELFKNIVEFAKNSPCYGNYYYLIFWLIL